MPNPTVSSIVASIVAAFDSGMDVFKRLQSERKESKLRRASKKNTRDREDEEEQHLCRSLQRGPSDIMTEYERNTRRFGERFERGDELAQTSLAHTLLALNAGLMKIISSFMCMSHDAGPGSSRYDELARQSLLSLSQTSAAEAVSSLQDLRERMILSASVGDPRARVSPRRKTVPRDSSGRRKITDKNDTSSKRSGNQQGKRGEKQPPRKQTAGTSAGGSKSTNSHAARLQSKTPKPKARSTVSEPVQGAWVRSKNHSSICIVSAPPTKSQQKSSIVKPINKHVSAKPYNGPDYSKYARPDVMSTDRLESSLNVSGYNRHLSKSKSEAQLKASSKKEDARELPGAYPISQMLATTPQNHNRVSIMSFNSGSTKLGEIPQHKWAVPWVPPVENESDEEYDNGTMDARRKKNTRTGFVFFRRFGKN